MAGGDNRLSSRLIEHNDNRASGRQFSPSPIQQQMSKKERKSKNIS